VSRWQAAISPQGACQGSTDVSVRTITWFKASGEKAGEGNMAKKNKTRNRIIFLQLIFLKAIYPSKTTKYYYTPIWHRRGKTGIFTSCFWQYKFAQPFWWAVTI
jgi:hypothetical protein